jgi:hypothetical protein
MMNFPASPTLNQQYSSGTTTWQWDGVTWNIVPQPGPMAIGDLPPANPAIGQQWWRSTNGQLYVWYNDGNSSQWVQAAAPGQKGVDPYQFITADMALVSMAAGIVGLNSKADGSGTNGALWSNLNSSYNGGGNGYEKFPNGLIAQWGSTVNSLADYTLAFPTAFPTACFAITMLASVNGIGATTIYSAQTSNVSRTQFDVRTRSITTGAVAGAPNCPVYWMAWGN